MTKTSKEGIIYYQITYNRSVRLFKTYYRLLRYEWDNKKGIITERGKCRYDHLRFVKKCIDKDILQLNHIITQFKDNKMPFTSDDIISVFQAQTIEPSLFCLMQDVITQLRQMGKQRTRETYSAALKSFMRFRANEDIPLKDIDSDLIQIYEAYLQNCGLTRNSTSFYMRILRAVYNRAVEKELITDRTPFKHVYTGVDKTIKRAISLKAIKQIKNLDLSLHPSLDFARDMFLFSFYTRGMSFIDMAYLRRTNLKNGILTYNRRKTGQQLSIRWERCMQDILDKYENPTSDYLLPIIRSKEGDGRKQYQNAMCLVNRKLKTIGEMVGCQQALTMYTARHSWASVAKNKNIPISVISEAMGHESEMTTQIYLASLDTAVVDKANSMILNSL